MLIALIDDGIDISLMTELRMKFDLYVDKRGLVSERRAEKKILSEHGTTCAKIIHKYAPTAEFCSIRIFHKHILQTPCDYLISALEWCYESKIPIIHMSIGSKFMGDYAKIRNIIAKMLRQRQIIIAAHSNDDLYSVPACISGVLGVKTDKRLSNCEYYVAPSLLNSSTLFASSKHELSTVSEKIVTKTSNSYAAPVITALVHNIVSKYEPFSMTVTQITKQILGESSILYSNKPDCIDDAYIINPDGFSILKSHLFFSCLEESQEILDLDKNSLECPKDLVYLPSFDLNQTARDKNLLWKNRQAYLGILYGGKIDFSENMQSENEMLWCENVYSNILTEYGKHLENYSDLNIDLGCPIINMYGNSLETIELMCKLRDLFLLSGYQCICVSDYPFSYLYNVEYIPDDISRGAQMSRINKIYLPDIVIYFFRKMNYCKKQNQDEYSIFMGYNNIDILPKHYKNRTYVSEQMSDESLVVIYDNIATYFS